MSNIIARISLLTAPIIRYFKFRPAFSWSVFSFLILLLFLLITEYNTSYISINYKGTSRFEMVEFVIDSIEEPEAEIEVTDHTVKHEVVETLEFGNSSGTYGQITEGATPPRPVFSALPEYPRSMHNAGIEGSVVLELGIDENGTVLYGRIVHSMGQEFDKAAIEWIQTIAFYPALDPQKRPFACRIRLPIKFKLDN